MRQRWVEKRSVQLGTKSKNIADLQGLQTTVVEGDEE